MVAGPVIIGIVGWTGLGEMSLCKEKFLYDEFTQILSVVGDQQGTGAVPISPII
jgi:hypothetical protein